VVAAVEPVVAIGSVPKELTGPEAYFARLIACDGFTPTRAYRIAWKSDAVRAKDIAPRVLARERVAAKIRELKAQADRDGMLRLNERRALLADTARRFIRVAPSHGDRIAAIREDAILAGERNEQSTITADVSLTAVLRAIERTGDVRAAAGVVLDIAGVPSAPQLVAVTRTEPESAPTHTEAPDDQKPYVSAGEAAVSLPGVVVDAVFSQSYEE